MREENIVEEIDLGDKWTNQIVEAFSKNRVRDIKVLLRDHAQLEDRLNVAERYNHPEDVLRKPKIAVDQRTLFQERHSHQLHGQRASRALTVPDLQWHHNELQLWRTVPRHGKSGF